MMYPFLTLDDETEIVHSDMLPDHRVKVYVEKPDENDGFHHMTCYLPSYEITEISDLQETKSSGISTSFARHIKRAMRVYA